MVDVDLGKQLLVKVSNSVGTLAEVSSLISSSGINLLAVCAYAVDKNGLMMFVCDNHKRAIKILKEKKYDVREEEIVFLTVDNKPGALLSATQRISECKIDITLLYGSVEQKSKKSRIVLIAENNNAVIAAIKTM
ncbi:MAG: hypothetical protein PHY73_05245 [Candidatus Omnitrophica bacterium]|nr:hypothetical protein [Candidatus Omnitrophota bacterium]